MDRNLCSVALKAPEKPSLSARRAWIEILESKQIDPSVMVALRKESVDRNCQWYPFGHFGCKSLSARRAWIEINVRNQPGKPKAVALRKESVDRNADPMLNA